MASLAYQWQKQREVAAESKRRCRSLLAELKPSSDQQHNKDNEQDRSNSDTTRPIMPTADEAASPEKKDENDEEDEHKFYRSLEWAVTSLTSQ